MHTGMGLGINGGAVTVCALLLAGCATTSTEPAVDAAPAGTVVEVTEPPLLVSELRADSPHSYTIQPGDNVYDVSAKFLDEPWRWRGLWSDRDVPQLYPGNVLQVSSGGGAPQLQVRRGGRPTIRLSPQVRVESVNAAIPTIPSEAITPFLNNAIVMTEDQWRSAPYVVGNEYDSIVATVGSRVFARGGDFVDASYRIYRPEEQLSEPGSGESLGHAMIYIGEARVEGDDDPAELRVVDAERGIRPGDRLVAVEEQNASVDFLPRPVPVDTEGVILSVLDAGISAGRYNSVAVNLGAYDGIEQGHVMAVYSDGAQVVDPVTGEALRLPDNRAGVIIVYKVFDLVSYGLVVETEGAIRLNDRVGEP